MLHLIQRVWSDGSLRRQQQTSVSGPGASSSYPSCHIIAWHCLWHGAHLFDLHPTKTLLIAVLVQVASFFVVFKLMKSISHSRRNLTSLYPLLHLVFYNHSSIMYEITTMTATLQKVISFLFLFAFAPVLFIIIIKLFYNIARGLHHIYTHADQERRAKYRYYASLTIATLFVWNLLLREQEACALRMAGDVMDWLKEMRLLDWFAFDEQVRLV